MKVLNFLEWFGDTKRFMRDKLYQIADVNQPLFTVHEFYEQPFKPEMITELFEGWKEKQREVYMWIDDVVTNIIEIYYDKTEKITYGNSQIRHEYPEQILRVDLPQTLNDFISDCQRAGIELTWKPEIINKYFTV